MLLVLSDVFFTVFFPASGHGPIRDPLAGAVWHTFRFLAKGTGGARRRSFLSFSGPVLIVVTLAVWFWLLVLGWGMIYKPALAGEIQASSGPTDTGWSTAIYFSGFSLTTLGVGDVAAKTGTYRLLAIAEAAVGFSFFSAVITYFLSVYSSLTNRNAFAEGLHHLTAKSDDAAEALVRLAADGDPSAVRQRLSAAAEKLRQIHQAQRFYPVLRYFHYRDPLYALPRILLTTLETVTLMRSALDPKQHAGMMRSMAVDEVYEAAMALMHELVPKKGRAASRQSYTPEEWQKRYTQALARLEDAGIEVRDDRGEGAALYASLRAEWDRTLHALAVNTLDEGIMLRTGR